MLVSYSRGGTSTVHKILVLILKFNKTFKSSCIKVFQLLKQFLKHLKSQFASKFFLNRSLQFFVFGDFCCKVSQVQSKREWKWNKKFRWTTWRKRQGTIQASLQRLRWNWWFHSWRSVSIQSIRYHWMRSTSPRSTFCWSNRLRCSLQGIHLHNWVSSRRH